MSIRERTSRIWLSSLMSATKLYLLHMLYAALLWTLTCFGASIIIDISEALYEWWRESKGTGDPSDSEKHT